MRRLVATAALVACSGAWAQPAPPAPWERLDFYCQAFGSEKIDSHTFYRYGDGGNHETSADDWTGRYKWQSTPTELRSFWRMGDTDAFVNKSIDRGTGQMRITQNPGGISEYRCKLRTANKF